MIGDLHQLPPVVRPEDWKLLRPHYETPYFFGSLVLLDFFIKAVTKTGILIREAHAAHEMSRKTATGRYLA